MAPAEPFLVRLSAVAENVGRARQLATDHLTRLDSVSEACIDAVRLALTEAVSNVVLHAYRDQQEPGEVEIEITPNGTSLHLIVRDYGCGPTPNPDSPGIGMGILLMASLSDIFTITGDPDHGSEVRMTFSSC